MLLGVNLDHLLGGLLDGVSNLLVAVLQLVHDLLQNLILLLLSLLSNLGTTILLPLHGPFNFLVDVVSVVYLFSLCW